MNRSARFYTSAESTKASWRSSRRILRRRLLHFTEPGGNSFFPNSPQFPPWPQSKPPVECIDTGCGYFGTTQKLFYNQRVEGSVAGGSR